MSHYGGPSGGAGPVDHVPGGGRAERGLDGEGDIVSVTILNGDVRDVLLTLPADECQCCVTSPPYFGLRDYGVSGQIGLEASPDDYVAELVAVFREVRRALRDDGVLFLNLGDSYAANAASAAGRAGLRAIEVPTPRHSTPGNKAARHTGAMGSSPKTCWMIPARVALALQADGWWLRSDIIWAKPNPMPESVTDRPTSAHEHVFSADEERSGITGMPMPLPNRVSIRMTTEKPSPRSIKSGIPGVKICRRSAGFGDMPDTQQPIGLDYRHQTIQWRALRYIPP